MLQEKNINPWDGCISLERKTWDGGGRIYCFQDVLLYTAEWSSGWLVGFCLFGGFFFIIFLGPFDLPFFLPFSTSTSFPLPPLAEEQETRLSSVSWHPKKYKSTKKQCILFSQLTWIHRPAQERHLLPERSGVTLQNNWAISQGITELIIKWILFDLLGWLQECRMGNCDKYILLRVKNYLRLILTAVLMGGWIADLQGLKSDWAVGEAPDADICEANSSANLAW